MNAFVVELPAELKAEVARRAGAFPGGESAWVAEAVREKLAACAQLDYLEARAAKGSREAYERVLAKVPAADPVPGDEQQGSGRTNGSS
jgi:hypothetical protein